MINYKPKCLAIPLIHTNEYLKYQQKNQNTDKFLVNFSLHEENWEKELFCLRWVPKISQNLNKWSPKVSNNTMKCHFPKRRNYVCKDTAQKMKFSITGFFSKYDQIRRKLRIWLHLLKKSSMENFIFCAVRDKSVKVTFLSGVLK